MEFKHLVIHKDTDWHSAFPEIIRLKNGDFVCVFRQAPVRKGTGVHRERNAKVTHFHQDANSRIALVRSTDHGLTWPFESRTIVDESDGTQDLNLAMISQVSSGELIVNNMRLFAYLDEEKKKDIRDERQIMKDRPERPFDSMGFDSLYLTRSADNGYTWSKPGKFGVPTMDYWTHTGQTGIVELPDGTWLLPFHGHGPNDSSLTESYNGDESPETAKDRIYIARSTDQGKTWGQPSVVMQDPDGVVAFHEPPMIRLSSGRLLIVTRTSGADNHFYQAHSDDDGWTWQGIHRTSIVGVPSHLLELENGHILCTYGYRNAPFGIKACFSYDSGMTWDTNNEIVIRDDGMHLDLGYPASIQLDDGKILSVYYFHGNDGVRYIGGSIWSEDDVNE